MKKFIFLLLIELFCINPGYSKKIPAAIQLKDGTTLEGKIKIRRYALSIKRSIVYPLLQNKIKYYDKDGNKKKLFAEQIKEVSFNYKKEDIKMQTIILKHRMHEGLFIKRSDYVLLKLKSEGKIKRFLYFHNTSFMGIHFHMMFNVLQKGNDEGFVPQWFNDFKNTAKYVSECPNLVEKINNEIYNSHNVKEIVKEYNNCLE